MSTYTLPDDVNLPGEMAQATLSIRRMTQCLAMAREQELTNQFNRLLNLTDEAELLFKTSSTITQQLKRRMREA